MSTVAPTFEDQASEFAAAVREQLLDLPESELDELLDGLQADLVERLADGGELGEPSQYADELRQAAGLPARDEGARIKPRRSARERMRASWADTATRTRAFWDATPGRRAIRDFLVSLRPVWWVARGMVFAQLLLLLVGQRFGDLNPFSALVMIGLVIVSVQWGRGLWAPTGWLVVLRRAASTLVAILLLPFMMIAANQLMSPSYVYVDSGVAAFGLAQDGRPVTNIFAFDCAGQPLDGVQLFDQRGTPITTLDGPGELGFGAEPVWGFDEERQQNIVYGRNGLAGYSGMWNVFPLQEARANMDRDPSQARAEDAVWPMDETLPLSPLCTAEQHAETQADQGAGATSAQP